MTQMDFNFCAPRSRPSVPAMEAVMEQGVGAPLHPAGSSDCTIHVCSGVTRRATFIREIPNYGWCEIRFGGQLLTVNRQCVTFDR